LTQSDCSDVPAAVLSKMKTPSGKKIFSGEGAPGLIGEAPRAKQKWLEFWNKGQDYDLKVRPESTIIQPTATERMWQTIKSALTVPSVLTSP